MAWTTPRVWVSGETVTAALLNAHLKDNLEAAFPVGSLHFFMQASTTVATTVNGFALEANGVAVSRTTYAALHTKLSGLAYPFGSGDGSTTVTLPDLQGRMPIMMASGGHTEVDGLGDSDGLAKASRTPKHNSTHSLDVSPSSHTHTEVYPNNLLGVTTGGTNAYTGQGSQPSGGAVLTLSGSIGPGGTRPNDLVPYLVVGIVGVKY